ERKPSREISRFEPAAPPSRFVSDGGRRISTWVTQRTRSTLEKGERTLNVRPERLHCVDRDARDRGTGARPGRVFVEALLHSVRERLRPKRKRVSRSILQ